MSNLLDWYENYAFAYKEFVRTILIDKVDDLNARNDLSELDMQIPSLPTPTEQQMESVSVFTQFVDVCKQIISLTDRVKEKPSKEELTIIGTKLDVLSDKFNDLYAQIEVLSNENV